MRDSSVQLNDLPDEILLYIFKKLCKVEILYSLLGVNQRLNRIVYDPTFTNHLTLLTYYPDQDIYRPLPGPMVDRFCSQILPEIGYQVKTLCLEPSSMERILHATNYPTLNNLTLYDMNSNLIESFINDENPLIHIFKNRILSLSIDFNDHDPTLETVNYTYLFIEILTLFTNLQYLIIRPSSCSMTTLWFSTRVSTVMSSTLLELHVSVTFMKDLLYLIDGRFAQLRALYVTLSMISDSSLTANQTPIRNLRLFSLHCDDEMYDYNESLLPILHRMRNLEELDLNIIMQCDEKFIDGNILKKDIIHHIPQLYKFTFNIHSKIDHRHQTNFPSNEYIQKTFGDFYNNHNQIITCIDHFEEARFSQCHIYSYPYKLTYYTNATNNFPNEIFSTVTKVLLYDERPFEYDFFIRIAQAFPFMKELTIKNEKAQNDRKSIELNNDKQSLSIIKYANLTGLNLTESHDDYVELFLFDTKMCLSNDIYLWVNYRSLVRLTENFTRYTTRNNCEKVTRIYLYWQNQIHERFKDYFPNIDMK